MRKASDILHAYHYDHRGIAVTMDLTFFALCSCTLYSARIIIPRLASIILASHLQDICSPLGIQFKIELPIEQRC